MEKKAKAEAKRAKRAMIKANGGINPEATAESEVSQESTPESTSESESIERSDSQEN